MITKWVRRKVADIQRAPRPWADNAAWKADTNNLNAVRAVLALLVIGFHSPTLLHGSEFLLPLPFFALEPGEQVHFVGVRVLCFFFVSGLLLARSFDRAPRPASFLGRRAIRLYPAFLVCAALCLWLFLPFAGGAQLPSWRTTIPHLLTFRVPAVVGAFPSNAITDTLNGSLWTLLYEAWCCVTLVILGAFGIFKRRGIMLALLSVIWSTYLLQWFGTLEFPLRWENQQTWLWIGTTEAYPRLLSCFLSGVAFYLHRDRIPWHPTLFWSSLGLLLLAAVFGLTGPALPLFGAYCLAYLAFHPHRRAPQVLSSFGDISYGIFLYGYPVAQLLLHHFGAHLNAFTLFLLTLPPTLVLAYLSYRFVEQPIAAWLQRSKKTKAAPAAQESRISGSGNTGSRTAAISVRPSK